MEVLKEKVPMNIFERLQIVEISTLDYFFITSEQEICDKTHLSEKDVSNLKNIISEILLNDNFKTATELRKDEKYWSVLHTGCSIIDKATKGFLTKGITEIFGESGVGKSQIALHLALQVQNIEENGGLDGGAVYICTEDIFPSKRLKQMIECHPKLVRNNTLINYSDNIFVEQIQDTDELKHCVNIKIPVLLSRKKVKLIIIDSIAAAFRYDNETQDYISRSEDLRLIASSLNNLALQYHVAIVCINQVTSDPKFGIKPCLGLAWRNLVRKRMKVYRSGAIVTMDNQNLPVRKIEVIFSPDTASNQCSFVVTKSGIVGIDCKNDLSESELD